MKILRLIKAGLAPAALAGLLLGAAPAVADSDADYKALSEAAIELAATLVDAQAKATNQDDEDAVDRLDDAEKSLRRAQRRFGAGNYEGALDHAKEVEDILK